MEEAIKGLPAQFDFMPVVQNDNKLKPKESFVVGGMGGSHLAAGLLKILNPSLNIYIHRDYGLPALTGAAVGASNEAAFFRDGLFIACSYSGNTEETLDFAEKAFEKGYSVAAIAVGGKLIDFAKDKGIPYIVLPDTGIQPRSALGFSLMALIKLIENDDAVSEIQRVGTKLSPLMLESEGQKLAEELRGKIPIVYSSRRNAYIAYNWKIKFNETGKVPAFYNIFPELNHNEMAGFDVVDSTKNLSGKFHFIFLEDSLDNPKILHRMEICKELYENRGLPVKVISLSGATLLEKILNSLMLADWTALGLSKIYGTEPSAVPIVEEFKKLI